jgi:hypothetical protein
MGGPDSSIYSKVRRRNFGYYQEPVTSNPEYLVPNRINPTSKAPQSDQSEVSVSKISVNPKRCWHPDACVQLPVDSLITQLSFYLANLDHGRRMDKGWSDSLTDSTSHSRDPGQYFPPSFNL